MSQSFLGIPDGQVIGRLWVRRGIVPVADVLVHGPYTVGIFDRTHTWYLDAQYVCTFVRL